MLGQSILLKKEEVKEKSWTFKEAKNFLNDNWFLIRFLSIYVFLSKFICISLEFQRTTFIFPTICPWFWRNYPNRKRHFFNHFFIYQQLFFDDILVCLILRFCIEKNLWILFLFSLFDVVLMNYLAYTIFSSRGRFCFLPRG